MQTTHCPFNNTVSCKLHTSIFLKTFETRGEEIETKKQTQNPLGFGNYTFLHLRKKMSESAPKEDEKNQKSLLNEDSGGNQPPSGNNKNDVNKLLIAEDNDTNMEIICELFDDPMYKIIKARNGKEAVLLAEINHPDIILMDIQMPIMTGLEAMQIIKENPALRNTPIIALTALAMPGDKERFIAAGADDFVNKPFDFDILEKMIKNYLSK